MATKENGGKPLAQNEEKASRPRNKERVAKKAALTELRKQRSAFRKAQTALKRATRRFERTYRRQPRVVSGPATVVPSIKKIDITPTWRSIMPTLVQVASNGRDEKGRSAAMDELLRLADHVDAMNGERGEGGDALEQA